jgi:ATP-dependent Clp protease adaptor protein ClpS
VLQTPTTKMNQEELLEETDILTEEPFVLILHNDDFNTFDWVIRCLILVCHHKPTQAEQCANIVHFNGKCDVKRGEKKTIRTMYRKLQDAGLTVSMEKLE